MYDINPDAGMHIKNAVRYREMVCCLFGSAALFHLSEAGVTVDESAWKKLYEHYCLLKHMDEPGI